MSVHEVRGVRAVTFEVRWRPGAARGAQRCRRFKTREEAERFDRGVRAFVNREKARRRWDAIAPADRRRLLEQLR